MARFKFRLSTIEKHRKLEEENERVNLLKTVQETKSIEKKLIELDSREVWARNEFASIGESGSSQLLTTNAFYVIDKFIRGQEVRRKELQVELRHKQLEMTAAYNSFLDARKKRLTVEKLREKKLREFVKEQRKKEIKEIDDLNIMRRRFSND